MDKCELGNSEDNPNDEDRSDGDSDSSSSTLGENTLNTQKKRKVQGSLSKPKDKKRLQKYKNEWKQGFSWLTKEPLNEFNAKCKICGVNFTVASAGIGQVDIVKQTEEGDVSNYQANGEFDLVSFSSVKHIEYYSCCSEPYPDITYIIKIRRRPLFYVFNLILPCILINGIALLVFYVPSESGEKVTLGISALLSMTVFLMTIRETLPPTEKTPLISMYYGASICLVSFASGLSVVTLNIYHRGVRGQAVPNIVKSIVLKRIAPLVFIKFDNKPKDTKMQEINPRTGTRLDAQWPWSEIPVQEDGCCLQQRTQRSPRFASKSRGDDLDLFEKQIIRVLNRLQQNIEKTELRICEQERKELTELEWKQTSIVLDRLLLGAFFFITIITSTTILCRSPQDAS